MLKSALKKLLSFLLTLFLVSFFLFSILSLMKGDSSYFVLSEDIEEEIVLRYREERGLNKSFFSRYFYSLKNFFLLNWGNSSDGLSIKDAIFSNLPVTLYLSFSSLLLSSFFSLSLTIASLKRGTFFSFLHTFLSSLFLVTPPYLSSLALVLILSFLIPIFPVAGYYTSSFLTVLRSLFLPCLTLSFLNSAYMLRFDREALLETLNKPYIVASRAKGEKEKRIITHSALKPSLPTILNCSALSFIQSLSGSCVVENVFALPGLGSLLLKSAMERDVSLSFVLTMVIAIIVSLTLSLIEIVNDYIDPRRMREDGKN